MEEERKRGEGRERRGEEKNSTAANNEIVKKRAPTSPSFSTLSPSNSHPCTHISPQRDHGRQNWVSRRASTREELPVFFCSEFFFFFSASSAELFTFSLSIRSMPALVGYFFIHRTSNRPYLSVCREAGESEEPPREEEPDATPPRAAKTTLDDAMTELLAPVPRPEGDASAGDAQRASKAAMAEAGSGEEKRREAEESSGNAKKRREINLLTLAA